MAEIAFEPKRIVVTGGCGFIGSSFVHHVVREHLGVHVTVLDKLTYAGNPDNLTVLREIFKAFGRPEDDFDWVRDRPVHDRRYAIDAAKLRRELGWQPSHTDFAAGLAETIAWYRDNEAWWRPAKEATEARCAAQGQ